MIDHVQQRALLVSIGLLGATLLVLLVMRDGTEEPDRLRPADGRKPGERVVQPAVVPGRSTHQPAGGTIQIAKAREAGGLHGRVVTSDGRPVKGARVRAYRLTPLAIDPLVPFPSNPLVGQKPRVTRSSSQGVFRFDGLLTGAYRLTADHSLGSSPLSGPFQLVAGRPTGPLLLRLHPLFGLSGLVTDASGKAIPGARVTLMASNQRSVPPQRRIADKHGGFRFSVVAGLHALRVVAPGHVSLLFPDIPAPRRDVRLVLPDGGGIVGQVTQAGSGQAIVGAVIDGVLGDWRQTVRSDAEGRFRFPQLPVGEALLTVTHPGMAPRQRALRIARGKTSRIAIKLRRGLTLVGRVILQASGSPLAGVSLVGRPVASSMMSVHRTRTDDQGAFRLTGLRRGAWRIWLASPQYTLARPLEVFLQADREVRVSVRAVRNAQLSGQLLDQQAQPVSGATVLLLPGLPFPTPWLARRSVTDAQGRFTLAVPLVNRRFQLEIAHAKQIEINYGPLELAPGEQKQLTIRLPPAATVGGRVRDPAGVPVAGALLSLYAIDPGAGARNRVAQFSSDRQGAFVFAQLHPQTQYQLRVQAAGLRTHYTEPFQAPAGRRLPLEIRLEPATRLAGRVATPDGQPVVGAILEAIDQPTGQLLGRARTDHAGQFSFDSLSAGPYGISAYAPGYAQLTRADVRPGAALELQLVRERTITLEVDLPLDYHFSYTVRLFALDGKSEKPLHSESFPPTQRRHTLGPLPAGRYKLVAEGPGLVRVSLQPVAALGEGGAVLYLQLRMGRMIVGTLVDAAGKPIHGAIILRGRVAPTVTPAQAQTDGLVLEATHADGSFHLTGFEGDRTTITIMHAQSLTRTVTVAVGQGKHNRIQLQAGHALSIQLSGSKPGGRQLRLEGPVVRQVLSDPTGAARIGGLAPGRYQLRIDGKTVQHSTITIPELKSIRVPLAD